MPDESRLTEEELKDLEESMTDDMLTCERAFPYQRSWCSNGALVKLIATARRAAEMEDILKVMTWPMGHSEDCKYWVGSCICGLDDFQRRRTQLFEPDERDGGKADPGADQV